MEALGCFSFLTVLDELGQGALAYWTPEAAAFHAGQRLYFLGLELWGFQTGVPKSINSDPRDLTTERE